MHFLILFIGALDNIFSGVTAVLVDTMLFSEHSIQGCYLRLNAFSRRQLWFDETH